MPAPEPRPAKPAARTVGDPRRAFELLRLAERCAEAGTWSWNVKTGEVFWSDGMFELLGLDAARVEPSFERWRERVHPDDRAAADRQVEQWLDVRGPVVIRYRIVRPGGSVHSIDAFGSVVFDRRGRPERLSGFCIDATARHTLEVDKAALEKALGETRRHEAELRRSRDALELALAASGQGFWDYDHGAQRMAFDDRACGMLSYRPGQMDTSIDASRRLIHPDDERDFKADLAAHVQGKSDTLQVETRVRHRSGRWVWALISGRAVERNAAGRVVRMVGTILDISKFKRLSDEGARLIGRFKSLLEHASMRTVESARADDRDAREQRALEGLSGRQRQTLALVAQGMTSAQIAQVMTIAPATAVVHRRDVMKRLGLHNAAELARFAVRHRIVDD